MALHDAQHAPGRLPRARTCRVGWLTLALTLIRCRTSVGSSWRTTAASTRCAGCSRSGSSSCSSCSAPTLSRPTGSRHSAPRMQHSAPRMCTHRMCTACAPHVHRATAARTPHCLCAVGVEPPGRRTAVAAGGAARDGRSSRRAADARFLLQATPRGARPLRSNSVLVFLLGYYLFGL